MVNTTEEITDLVCSTCCYVQQIKSLHKATLGWSFFFSERLYKLDAQIILACRCFSKISNT